METLALKRPKRRVERSDTSLDPGDVDGFAGLDKDRLEDVFLPPVIAVSLEVRGKQLARVLPVLIEDGLTLGALRVVSRRIPQIVGDGLKRNHRGMRLVHRVRDEPPDGFRQLRIAAAHRAQVQPPGNAVVHGEVVPHQGLAMKQPAPLFGLRHGDPRRDHLGPGPHEVYVGIDALAQFADVIAAAPVVGIDGRRHGQAIVRRQRGEVAIELVDDVRVRLREG